MKLEKLPSGVPSSQMCLLESYRIVNNTNCGNAKKFHPFQQMGDWQWKPSTVAVISFDGHSRSLLVVVSAIKDAPKNWKDQLKCEDFNFVTSSLKILT